MRTGLLGALVVISLASTSAVTGDNSTILVRSKRQGLLGSLFKPVLDAGKPRPQEQAPQGAEHPHGAPIQDKNVVNKFLENLQRSQHNFNVPRRRSSFFGPAINALRQFQICTTPLTTPGKCRYVRECVLPAFLENFDLFLSYSCVISNRHLGVCCPDEFFGNLLTPRKPLFPILSGLLNIGKKPSSPPPVQNPDYEDGPGGPNLPNVDQPLTPDELVDGHGVVQPPNPPPSNSPTANAPIQFPDDDEEEAEAHDASAHPQKPPSQPQPSGGQTSERQKPLPPVPPGLAQLTTSCGLNFKTRIVGGTIAKPDDWTWMAALLRKADDDQFCGGALISDRYVITAAHCTQGLRPQNITVRLGEYDFKTNTTSRLPRDFNVSRIRQHPEFRKDTYQNDISLLRMSRRVRFTENIRPICLPKSPDESFIGKLATVVGWGTLSFGGPSSSILRQVSLPVWDNTECKTKFTQQIPKIFLCAGTREGGQDACQGDSGGPLMVEDDSTQWTLIGVVSWGIKCAEKGLPGVYTRITEFLGWIYENAV
ncbi:hypothetical protein HPB52_008954 [Rhipicephalus sanguineus]|uniref:Peptidase S1 domain-containing protein n=1 Tax=Rhipicephalus sanguineus TaxID=34632 RepID=A0A9D4PQH8_RHISA|nr:hypothetical protein HPB52_008954 [Rhipicephalus sanguineus]